MAAKIILALCAQALLIKASLSQVLPGNALLNSGFGTTGFGSILNSANVGSAVGNAISASALGNAISGSVLGSSVSGSPVSGSAATVAGLTGLNIVAGGPLAVTSVSPISPTGLAVASENVLEGVLTVNGQLPFLSAVAFEGGLPTSGSGVATCGCGNGQVAITSEGLPGGIGYGRI